MVICRRSDFDSEIIEILQISWTQVREKHIKNKEVRAMFLNNLNINAIRG